MDLRLEAMLNRYNCNSRDEYENALKEIMQEIALLGLWRSKFFEKAAFYGGTALRILYGLDRFSEDLDFSLLSPDKHFELNKYNSAIVAELESFGLTVTIDNKQKNLDTNIKSAFIKAGTKKQLIIINANQNILSSIHDKQLIKIKLEIDIDPPLEFQTETKILLQPIPFSVCTYQLPDLFAGKIHAILCRQWGTRVKGRDWYDLVWYISRNIPVRIIHLKERLIQSKHLSKNASLEKNDIVRLLNEKIENLNINQAKKNVVTYLKDPQSIDVWSKEFFSDVVSRLSVI